MRPRRQAGYTPRAGLLLVRHWKGEVSAAQWPEGLCLKPDVLCERLIGCVNEAAHCNEQRWEEKVVRQTGGREICADFFIQTCSRKA